MGDFSESSCHRKKKMCLSTCDSKKTAVCPRSYWGDWSDLPRNVLFDIMDRLTVTDDYVVFGAVCVSWRNIFIQEKSENKHKHCSQPFILVSSPDVQKHQLVMYSFSRKRIYEFDLHLPDNNTFSRVSSLGWLVTMEIRDNKHYNVHLQNPFLPEDRIIHLPPLDNIIQQHPDADARQHSYSAIYFRKAALSSDPLLSDEFAVVAIMNRFSGLAFFKSGSHNWTSIGEWENEWRQGRNYLDVIFSNTTKQFYALRCNGQVLTINLAHLKQDGGEPDLIQLVPPINLSRELVSPENKFIGPTKSYLVEDLSSGELLQVLKCYIHSIQTFYFVVFKLDPIEKSWSRIHDLANKVMFLGLNSSVVRSASDCPGCKPNCIYYTDDLLLCFPCKKPYGPKEDGIFSLEENTVLPHYSTLPSEKTFTHPIWVEPTLVNS